VEAGSTVPGLSVSGTRGAFGLRASPITQSEEDRMWTWTKVAGRALINIGLVVLAIVAAKELVDTGCDVADAMRGGSPMGPPEGAHPIPPMA
jgi:hypothetical protein